MKSVRILAITVVILTFGLLFQTYRYIDSNKHFNELYAESQKTVKYANELFDLGEMWKRKYDSLLDVINPEILSDSDIVIFNGSRWIKIKH